MNSPAAALTWEIWRRHRMRLFTIVSLILFFVLFYPKLCALAGLNLDAPDALDDVATKIPQEMKESPSLFLIFRALCMLSLACGPVVCMVMSLLYVVWIFTFTNFDPRKPFAFPARFFTLPVSTTFLASWLVSVGTAVVLVVYLGWTRLVHLPHLGIFGSYHNCLAWVTLLVLSQAIVWSLDAFPFTRVLLLSAVCFGFLGQPGLHDYHFLERNWTLILMSLLPLSCGLAYTGLGKIRHGNWQRWTWKWRITARTNLTGPRQFRSPAQAQLWFEWRSKARWLLLLVVALAAVPLLIVSVGVAIFGPLTEEGPFFMCAYLLCVPIFIHFCHGMSPELTLLPFTAIRPMTNGEIVMAKLKAVARSTVLSWVVILMMLAVVPLLGDIVAAARQAKFLSPSETFFRPMTPILLLGLIFLTWRFAAANLCFGLTGRKWLAHIPALATYGFIVVLMVYFFLGNNPDYKKRMLQILPGLLGLLVVLKIILAQWAFRIALQRQLLSHAAMIKYLLVWIAFAVVFLVPTLISLYHEKGFVAADLLVLSLGIILCLPLARIGFAPTALSLGRHR
jgi:hypothetical protein